MSDSADMIPFDIEISRVIELLAAQIYPTPYALLRENVQNSYDAILQRKYQGDSFEPLITVVIETQKIVVSDNGIGMSRDDLRNHYWRAGSSSKNTDAAKAAGVVGTFGIGAMANFGIAEELSVETENIRSGERTSCFASKATLSVTKECITFKNGNPTGIPGTTVTALIQSGKGISVIEAENYISQFVTYLPIKVVVNDKVKSRNKIEESVPQISPTWNISEKAKNLGEGIVADVELSGAISGEVRVAISNIAFGSQHVEGQMILRQGVGSLKTFRSGFGLATASVSSSYQFGGIANFLFLKPTAGREALTTDSLELLQKITTRVDEFVSLALASRPESNSNNSFVTWIGQRGRYDLCSYLRVRVEPNHSYTLAEIKEISQVSPMLVYHGNDSGTISHASEDRPMLIISQASPRRDCEIGYLRKYCKIEELSNEPKVLSPKEDADLSSGEMAFAFRVSSILSSDYFLEAQVKFGTISHGLPILVNKKLKPIQIVLDPSTSTAKLILELYDKEYGVFSHIVKDFVRNVIFPKVSDLVPSATRQGAEAFLKTINRSREIFEYDTEDLQSLASLWQDYLDGKVSFQQATSNAERLVVRSHQVIDSNASSPIKDIMPDVIQNEGVMKVSEPNFDASPPIQRLDVSTDRKMLTIDESEESLKGYRCFLAITDRIKDERGDFFLQPHRTSIVWGGQKALFIFQHHSGNYGLYYDLQTQGIVSNESGGGAYETCTIVMQNRIFIPIPDEIKESFIPKSTEKKRFEVKCDILYIDK